MTTPGTQLVSRSAAPSRGGVAQTGTWHIAAQAERGRTDAPVLLNSLSDYDKWFGARVAYGQRDAVETYFRNGGTAINMIRIVGPAATVATVNLPGAAAAPSLAIDSVGAGASTLSVSVEVTGATFVLKVFEAGVLLKVSPSFASPAEAVTWSTDNPYVRVRALGTVLPITSAVLALAGGSDDRASITDAHRIAALNRIPSGAGTGQVSIPGATTSVAHIGVALHAVANNRFALLDAPNSAVKGDLVAASTAVRGGLTPLQRTYCFLVEGWAIIPGLTLGTTRVVPPSSVVAALMAARDVITGNPNDPAAGANGIPSYLLGLSRPDWSGTDRGDLNDAGVNVFREVAGSQRLYGYRTLIEENSSTDGGWVGASNARLRMAILSDADAAAESFVFSQITKAKIAEYNGVLSGMLLGYYNSGALFGDTPDEAFVVDTGTTVNTPDRLAERLLSAVVGVRMSEFAEIVYMEFVKIPVNEELT